MTKQVNMSRRHLELIAEVLREVKPAFPTQGESLQWRWTVERFTAELNSVNDRFDAARFEKACGLESIR